MTNRAVWAAAALTAAAFAMNAGTAAAQGAGGDAGLPMEKVLPMALAQEAARAAVAACARQGYRISVAVVDRAGVLRVLLRGDGAGPHTIDSSMRKAYTAASLRAATGQYAEMIAENPAVEGLRDMNERILFLAGGLPVKAGDDVVGGIGVGGAPGGDKDEVCAQAGLEGIAGALR
jgi:uncharacterized protein GlcG (DUF336 family)